jgi:hypothetical protein
LLLCKYYFFPIGATSRILYCFSGVKRRITGKAENFYFLLVSLQAMFDTFTMMNAKIIQNEKDLVFSFSLSWELMVLSDTCYN